MLSVGLTAHNLIRDNGTYFYCRRAFERMRDRGEIAEATHYLPRGEVGKHDFYLYVDDGQDHIKWLPPHPNAYYAIDTHLGYDYRVWKARQFDRVFVAQKDAVEQFKRDGVKHVEWLPLACDPEYHPNAEELKAKGADVSKAYDVAFVGFLQGEYQPGMNNRVEYLDALFKAIPSSWLSTGVFHADMALRYVRARVGFNVSIKRDLNMRCFEIMSTCTPLLTNKNVDGIDDLFAEGEHYIGYEGPDDAAQMARFALEDPAAATYCAETALAEVRAKHTYEHRMKRVLEVMSHV